MHKPVLLKEVINGLQIIPSGIYYDATFGRGGHAREILTKLNNKGKLIAVDRDIEAVNFGKLNFLEEIKAKKLHIYQACISQIKLVLASSLNLSDNLLKKGELLDGILFDLGVSSPQLEEARRGFSFMYDAPLDMRMDQNHGVRAKEWLESITEAELENILNLYGEERHSKKIASLIKSKIKSGKMNTTFDLANLIKTNIKSNERKHPATRTFQAIRIVLNDELQELQCGLEVGYKMLKIGGIFAIISFHSLEDRIVKNFIKRLLKGVENNSFKDIESCPDTFNLQDNQYQAKVKVAKKFIVANKEEVRRNPRSRSAILRIFEKLS